ncbi:hypothetical protein KC356_g6510 [Hortaea werneckii]|nr:hypothetical protein KC356_g6510 [Hortaea werneckii]
MAVESRQPDAFAIIFIFLGAATVTVCLRLFACKLLRQYHWDDILVFIAWAIDVAQTGTAAAWMKATWYGYHSSDVPDFTVEQQVHQAKIMLVQGLLYNPVLGLVKWSIIVFLMRLDDKRKIIKWTLRILLAVNLGHLISVFFGVLLQCSPVHMYWDHFKTDQVVDGQVVNDNYSCIDQAAFSLGTAAISVTTDIAILLVPIAIMVNLQLPLRRKLAVIIVLSLSWAVAVVGAIRIYFFVNFWYGRFPDPNWSLWNTLSGVENNVAIMVSCAPSIKAVITWYLPRFFGTSNARSNTTPYHYPGTYQLSTRPRADSEGGVRGKGSSTEAIVRSESLDGSGEFGAHSETTEARTTQVPAT